MTATQNHPCLIARDDKGNVLVKSVVTGNRYAVNLAKLSDDERTFVDALLPFGAEAKKIDLTTAEANRFRAIAKGQSAPKTAPVAKPTVVPAPVAKVETNGHTTSEDAQDDRRVALIGRSRPINTGGVNGTDHVAAVSLEKATKLAEAIKLGVWIFTYDIRDDVAAIAKEKKDPWLRCPNVSGPCRIGGKGKGKGWDFCGMPSLAAHDEDSKWLLTGKTRHDARLKRLMEHWDRVNAALPLDKKGNPAVKYGMHRIHDEEVERFYARAKVSIANKIKAARDSLTASLASADKALAELVAEPTTDAKAQDKAIHNRDSKHRSILVLAAARYYAAVDSAKEFDCTGDVKTLLDGLRNAVAAARDFFNARQDRTGKPSNVTV